MNNLSALITELCPNGVEYVPLWSVTIWDKRFNSVDRIKQPTAITYPYLLAADLFAMQQENGDVFLLSTGEQTGWTTEEIAGKYLCTGEVVTMPWGKTRPVADCAKYYRGKFVTADNRIMTSNNTSVLDNKYLYYWFISVGKVVDTFYRGSGIQHPDMAKVLDLQIPLPPIEVQREIVRILDTFTELTSELTENLSMELTARKQQYEYYRNKLLDKQQSSTKIITIGELGAWSGGKTPSMDNSDYWENGTIPWISSKDMKASTLEDTEDHITEQAVNEAAMTVYPANGIAVVTRSGILKHTLPVAFVPFETTVNQDIKMLTVYESVLPRYAFHAIQGKSPDILTKAKKQGGTVDSLEFKKFLDYKIPLPSLAVQKRLVEVLDNFDAICSDLNIGLPAEIEARKKQYEFYRDQLLTFAAQDEIVLTDRQTDRQTDEYNALIRLCQYVFGYISLPLESIFDIRNGYTPSKANPEYWTNGTVDWFRMEDIRANGHVLSSALQKVTESAIKNGKKIPANSIALSTSATIGEHALITVDCLGNQRFSFFTPKPAFANIINMKFMNYYFYKVDEWCKEHLFQGSFNSVDMGALKKLCIPIPSIDEQERIVKLLDHFSTLCTDLTSGLPAEIEARKKQYEYYRDNLLSFTPAD